MMDKAQPGPTDSLIFLTNRVGRLLANEVRMRSDMERLGLMPHHMGILVELWVKDGLRQQDLAIASIKDKGTIARALNAMEREGIIVREADPNDRRNKRIFLTSKGRKLKGLIIPQAELAIEEAVQGVAPADLQACLRVLKHVYNKLNGV